MELATLQMNAQNLAELLLELVPVVLESAAFVNKNIMRDFSLKKNFRFS